MAGTDPDSLFADFPSSPPAAGYWPDTIWLMVEQAQAGSETERQQALEQLAMLYTKPIYRFFQRVLGVHGEDLADLTQEFLTRFLEKDHIQGVRYHKSFRGFLKLACRRFYINWLEHRRVRSPRNDRKVQGLKDAGQLPDHQPLAEERFEVLLDEALRQAIREQAVDRVRHRLSGRGREHYLEALLARLEDPPVAYKVLAERYGVRVYDVRNWLSAARKAFRRAVWEVAQEHGEDAEELLGDLGILELLGRAPG